MRAEPRLLTGLMGEREDFGEPKVFAMDFAPFTLGTPPLASAQPLWVSSAAARLPVFLPPGFRFGRLFLGMAFLRRLICPRSRVSPPSLC